MINNNNKVVLFALLSFKYGYEKEVPTIIKNRRNIDSWYGRGQGSGKHYISFLLHSGIVSLHSGIESHIINPLYNSDFKMEVCNFQISPHSAS